MNPQRKLSKVVFLLLLLALLAAPSALAGPIIDKAARALRSDPVYVETSQKSVVSASQAADLREIIRDGNRAIFVAVLPQDVGDEVDGKADALVPAVGKATGLTGTYVVLAGKVFRVQASKAAGFPEAGEIATENFQKYSGDGKFAVLSNTVEDLANYQEETAAPANPSPAAGDDDGGGFPWWLLILASLVGFGVGVWAWVRQSASRSKVRGKKSELKSRLYENNYSLEVVGSTARAELATALNLRDEAVTALNEAKTLDDLNGVEALLDKSDEHYRAALAQDFTPREKTREKPTRQRRRAEYHSVPTRERPTKTDDRVTPPDGGRDYGYYPNQGGWGYYDPLGFFILGTILADSHHDHSHEATEQSSSDYSPDPMPTTVGGGDFSSSLDDFGRSGGGDFGSSSSSSDSDSGFGSFGGGDSFGGGGGGGGDFGGGGGDSGGGGGDSGGGGGGDF